jgi:hypothetical protein
MMCHLPSLDYQQSTGKVKSLCMQSEIRKNIAVMVVIKGNP